MPLQHSLNGCNHGFRLGITWKGQQTGCETARFKPHARCSWYNLTRPGGEPILTAGICDLAFHSKRKFLPSVSQYREQRHEDPCTLSDSPQPANIFSDYESSYCASFEVDDVSELCISIGANRVLTLSCPEMLESLLIHQSGSQDLSRRPSPFLALLQLNTMYSLTTNKQNESEGNLSPHAQVRRRVCLTVKFGKKEKGNEGKKNTKRKLNWEELIKVSQTIRRRAITSPPQPCLPSRHLDCQSDSPVSIDARILTALGSKPSRRQHTQAQAEETVFVYWAAMRSRVRRFCSRGPWGVMN